MSSHIAPQSLIDRLTDRQKECLRLVAKGYVTKEIARQLGINDSRASKDIDAAMKKLGVSRRLDAARILADFENRGVDVTPGASRPLFTPTPHPAFIPPSEARERPHRVQEFRSPYQVSSAPPDLGLPLRSRGSVGNDLSSWQRVIWIVLLSAAGLVSFGTLAMGVGSLSNRMVVPTMR